MKKKKKEINNLQHSLVNNVHKTQERKFSQDKNGGNKIKKFYWLILLIVTSILLVGCGSKNEEQEKTPLTISAAISLTDALDEIKEIYEKEHDVEITFNLGGSGSLAQQIQQGAPTDVFISANQQWMNTLEDENIIKSETRSDVTGNSLVLITSDSSSISYQSIEEISKNKSEKIAIGNPESVPAGKYAKESLENSNMWDVLEDQLVLTKDVRQVLTYVESEEAEIGFVYESDGLSSDKIKILATVDKDLHEPIIYLMAVTTDTKYEEASENFAEFMVTDEAQEILEKYGFKK